MVHAVVHTILTEIFDKTKMRELINVTNPEYQRAIDIVDEQSPGKVIKEFKELTN